jgi:hypothetical protein
VTLSDDWAQLHKTLDKLNSLANHPDVAQQNAAVYPMVPVNGNEQTYSVDTDPFQQQSPPGSTGLYAADSLQPMNRQDQRHPSVQYSVVSEVEAELPRSSYFPQAGPVSPDERAHPYYNHYEQQY